MMRRVEFKQQGFQEAQLLQNEKVKMSFEIPAVANTTFTKKDMTMTGQTLDHVRVEDDEGTGTLSHAQESTFNNNLTRPDQ